MTKGTVFCAQVHPIFVLSIVDTLLGVLWVSGSIVWLRGGLAHHEHLRVGCFALNIPTVVGAANSQEILLSLFSNLFYHHTELYIINTVLCNI